MKRLIAIVLACVAGAASAQGLEPGEWEFTTVTSSPMFPKPQSATFKQCIKQEDAENPERWMGKTDCTFTQARRGADTLTWEMSCPKSSMRGTGSARIGRGTMESDMRMEGDLRGRKFEMSTRMSGRRLGPCKS